MSTLKIVHLNTSFRGGAGRAVNRLHKALLKNDVQSSVIYFDSFLDLTANLSTKSTKYFLFVPARLNTFLQRQKKNFLLILKQYLGFLILGYKERRIGLFNKIYGGLDCEFASLPFSDYNILNNPLIKEAHIIHLHWVAGMVDYESFFKFNDKPIVWTLHDMNPFQGIFHYKEDELRNFQISGKLDFRLKELKETAISKRKSDVFVVSPSNWLLNESKKSKAFAAVNGLCIPNTIDTNLFTFQYRNGFKKNNNIPENNFVFLFVANSVKIHRKGFDLLIESLNNIKSVSFTLLVLGANEISFPIGLNIIYLGIENDDNNLINYYSVSDAFILPSREDNLPNVMLESLACGTPVIGFSVGGIKEHIVDYKTGLLAKEVNAQALTQVIEGFCINKHRFDREYIQNYAIENFGERLIANKYKNLYNDILKMNLING